MSAFEDWLEGNPLGPVVERMGPDQVRILERVWDAGRAAAKAELEDDLVTADVDRARAIVEEALGLLDPHVPSDHLPQLVSRARLVLNRALSTTPPEPEREAKRYRDQANDATKRHLADLEELRAWCVKMRERLLFEPEEPEQKADSQRDDKVWVEDPSKPAGGYWARPDRKVPRAG